MSAVPPKNPEKTVIQHILMLDLAGWAQGDIAKELNYTQSWVSTIQNCPMYMGMRKDRLNELQTKIVDGVAGKALAGDPVKEKIRALAIDAINTQEILMNESPSDQVRASIADKILDRAGYSSGKEKTVLSVEVTEKMASRFERVLSRDRTKHDGDARTTTYRVEKEMPS